MNIQWYPGHMTKTRRMITEHLKLVDALCEVVDARIPDSSRNPDLDALAAGKPRLVVLNRVDQADPEMTRRWSAWLRRQGYEVVQTDSRSGAGVTDFAPAVRTLLKEKLQDYQEKGQTGRSLRIMVVGVPNVGKSSLINRLSGRKSAKAEDRPGVTRGKQWVTVGKGLELLDTPGILWPKLEGENVGRNLAFTGAVRDEIMDLEELAFHLCAVMGRLYPERLKERYKLPAGTEISGLEGWEILEMLGRRRGFLISGGEVDLERMAKVLLDEFRAGKLGRITFEAPPEG